MHISLRAAGFSLMAMFASCGVGAQAKAQEAGVQALPGQHSLSHLRAPSESCFDKSRKLDDSAVIE